MKVIAKVTLVTPDGKGGKVDVPPGASTELSDAEARFLIAEGYAEAAEPNAPAAPAETAPAGDTSDTGSQPDPLAELLKRNAPEVIDALPGLGVEDLERLEGLEASGKARKGVLAAIEARLEALAGGDSQEGGAGEGGQEQEQ